MIIKAIILRCLNFLGINAFFRTLNRKKLVILGYHGISGKEQSYRKKYLGKSIFEKQVKYLKKKNFSFITLTNWQRIVKSQKKINQRFVIITFDDGFKNVIDYAYPIIKKYGAKGIIYVIPGIIGKNELIWTEYLEMLVYNHRNNKFNFKFKDQIIEYSLNSKNNIKMAFNDMKNKLRALSNKDRITHLNQFKISNNIKNFKNVPIEYLIANWQELNSLNKNILEIGNHTKTHQNLDILSLEQEYYEELLKSKLKIEKEIGYSIKHLCYPAGVYNNKVIQYLKKYGYLTGVTVEEGLNMLKSDLLKLKRLMIDKNFLLFKYKVSGLYSFLQNRFGAFF